MMLGVLKKYISYSQLLMLFDACIQHYCIVPVNAICIFIPFENCRNRILLRRFRDTFGFPYFISLYILSIDNHFPCFIYVIIHFFVIRHNFEYE